MLQTRDFHSSNRNKVQDKGFRPGKFRHRLLTESFLQSHANEILTVLRSFIADWERGLITDSEICAIYILTFLCFHRPKDWWSGRRSHTPLHTASYCKTERLWQALPDFVRRPSNVDSSMSVLDFFLSSQVRAVPEAVHRALSHWANRKYKLHLSTTIPTPLEVLEMQTLGTRCVSLLQRPEEMTTGLEGGRDPLGFLLHDLIHAEHFFSNSKMAGQQRAFYCWILSLYHQGLFDELLARNPDFKKDFEYISSDMNSHCVHLMMTLKAKIFEAFKYGVEAPQFYRTLLNSSEMTVQVRDVCERLNSQEFVLANDGPLLECFFDPTLWQ